jgi:hypothetical protein
MVNLLCILGLWIACLPGQSPSPGFSGTLHPTQNPTIADPSARKYAHKPKRGADTDGQ